MYKSIDFEYDLWKTSDGKCFARVKSTGEVCEISSDTMKLLRCEEKRIYRELALKKSLESENVDEKTKASIRLQRTVKCLSVFTVLWRSPKVRISVLMSVGVFSRE